jgi:hypothetical protein
MDSDEPEISLPMFPGYCISIATEHFGFKAAERGADPACTPDEAWVLRLVPYPDRKLSTEGVPTSLAAESGARYELTPLLDALASALASEATTPGCGRCHTFR